jgi:hypothetical protein
MSNPWSRLSAGVQFPNGPGQSTDNLTALNNNTMLCLGSIGASNFVYGDFIVAPIKFKSGASGVSANGTASLYLFTSEDGTIWTCGVSPSAASDQSGQLAIGPTAPGGGPRIPAQVVNVTAAGTQYYFDEFSVYDLLSWVPTFFTVGILNQSGAAFDSTAANFSAKVTTDQYA